MPTIQEMSTRFRADLLQRDRAAAARLVDAYGGVWRAIRADLDALLEKIDEARKNGEEVGPSWLLRRDRLAALLRQVEEQCNRFAAVAEGEITAGQRLALKMGAQNAQEAVQTALALEVDTLSTPAVSSSFARLPTGPLEHLVGALGDGTPLAQRLARFGPETAAAIRRELVSGLAIGRGPRDIARKVRDAAAVPLREALTISRTETLRAYRDSSIATYAQHEDVLAGWRWISALSERTCAACLAMHGRTFPLDVAFGSHPNCRCVPAPLLKSRETEAFESGEEWLEKQGADTQDVVLGAAAAQAWRGGQVSLSDFVQESHSEEWGTTRSVRPLRELIALP